MPTTTTRKRRTPPKPLYPGAITDPKVLNAPHPRWLSGRLDRACLRTFRRIPDEVIWAILGDDMEFANASVCLTGTAVREGVAAMARVDVADLGLGHLKDVLDGHVNHDNSYELAARLYGGTKTEWRDIYFGVIRSDEGVSLRDVQMKPASIMTKDAVPGWIAKGVNTPYVETPYSLPLIERAMLARMDEALTNSPR